MTDTGWIKAIGINGEKYWYRLVWSAVKAAISTDWLRADGFDRVRVHVTGINGDTVKIQSAVLQPNAALLPGTDYKEEASLTADDSVLLAGPFTHLKIECSTYSAGSLGVVLVAF